jgi:energy-coupling factor transport system substrate-specific component
MQEGNQSSDNHQGSSGRYNLALIPLGIAINVAIGGVVHALKLPLFLDAVGTISITLLLGLRAGVIVGVGSFLLAGILLSPVYPWFCCTQAAIAIYTHYFAKLGWFRGWRIIPIGLGLGIVAGIASAPVIVLVFGGVEGSGRSLITAFLLASGQQVLKSVVISGLASEPLDKTLQCLLAIFLLRGVPRTLLQKFSGGSLKESGILKETDVS